MTINRPEVQAYDPITKLISCLSFGKNALHDIHLRFHITGIWALLSTNSALTISPVNKDLRLPHLSIKDLNIRLTIHKSDTVSVVVGCSYAPIAVDCGGIIRLSNALTRVEERLSRLIDSCNSDITVTKDSNTSESSFGRKPPVPEHSSWVVTMWHFGSDGITEYTGDKFCVTLELGENVLIRVYTKDMKNKGTRVRLEQQQYPNKFFQEAMENKVHLENEN